MPINPSKAKRMLMCSDYDRDTVIWSASGTIAIDNYAGMLALPHGLPFTPLIRAVFSRTEDFATGYPNGYYEEAEQAVTLNFIANAEAVNVNLGIIADIETGTWYYRAFGLMPPDADGDVAQTAAQATNFITNSDANYTKVFMEGKITVGLTAPVVINHGLGWVPQVEVWNEVGVYGTSNSDLIGALDGSGDISGIPGVGNIKVDSDNLTVWPYAEQDTAIFYRIYLDDYEGGA